MRQPTRWEARVEADPQHSHWYVQRFRTMAAEGADLHGEARLVDAMVGRGSRVLDAGCGPGRVGGELARRGHTVVGVDVDPVLIDAAREDHPDATWLVGDLAELDVGTHGITEPFDVAVCAGNVMTFVAPGTEVEVLRRLGAAVAPAGRVVVGFGAGRGYPFPQFFDDARAAGLRVDVALSTWDLRPLEPDSDFLVAVLSPGGDRGR
ncbi:class I SAM-dependent methyltransferase [Actinotalea ferrariae]|uniref:class I SAM-dependent methyltransferase n=1 Tax=Actinotalea ferrariae TaxID=1386098 RepID=UPI001C8B5D8F|nr:class I SAM-dependent methyltransferase [Actinotalea ferrariae]MBX9244032.1 class I SAM-dependent methyltransferase [Actinotalea ferrariae]